MPETDNGYSIRSTWSCYWLDQFLTLANSTWILSKFLMFYCDRLLFILLNFMDVELLLCLAVNLSQNDIDCVAQDLYSTATGHRNRVAVRHCVRTATTIAVAVHNFRTAVFCYAKRESSAEETNRVQIAVCFFSPRFTLGLNNLLHLVTVQCMNSFTKHFPDCF